MKNVGLSLSGTGFALFVGSFYAGITIMMMIAGFAFGTAGLTLVSVATSQRYSRRAAR